MRLLLLGLVICLIWVTAGCRCGFRVPPKVSVYGRFEPDTATVILLKDGRCSKLVHDFTYHDPNAKAWLAPEGVKIDGATIPQLFWSVIGGPYEGKYRYASIVHDHYCRNPGEKSWQQVHLMFYYACLAGGTDEDLSLLMYAAVYHYGPTWADPEATREKGKLENLLAAERLRLAQLLATEPEIEAPMTLTTTPGRDPWIDLVLRDTPVAEFGVAGVASDQMRRDLNRWNKIKRQIRARSASTPSAIRELRFDDE